jgi:hypothetical protein
VAQFKYFAAPSTEVFQYSDREPCIHCGRVAPATLLKHEPETPDEFCCLECLAVGKSRIEHDTEIGFAEAERLSRFDDATLEMATVEPPAGFRTESLEELSRTPDFASHQGREFLVLRFATASPAGSRVFIDLVPAGIANAPTRRPRR